jgi:hypothetical protein
MGKIGILFSVTLPMLVRLLHICPATFDIIKIIEIMLLGWSYHSVTDGWSPMPLCE